MIRMKDDLQRTIEALDRDLTIAQEEAAWYKKQYKETLELCAQWRQICEWYQDTGEQAAAENACYEQQQVPTLYEQWRQMCKRCDERKGAAND
jgi:hypothetical protein